MNYARNGGRLQRLAECRGLAPHALIGHALVSIPMHRDSLVRLAFQKWSVWLLLAKSQRGGGLENLLPPYFLWGLGFAVFPEKEGFRKHQQPAKPLGQETVIASVHNASTFHVSFLLNGPRGRICTCNLPGLSGTPLLIGPHAVGSPSRSVERRLVLPVRIALTLNGV